MLSSSKSALLGCVVLFLVACSPKQEYLSCPYTSKTYYENGDTKVWGSPFQQHILIDHSKGIIFISKYGREMQKYSFDQIGEKIYFEEKDCYSYGNCTDDVSHKMKGEYDTNSQKITENVVSSWEHMQKTHLMQGKCSSVSPKEFGKFRKNEFTSTR